MKIELNVLNSGVGARVFAYADEGEPGFIFQHDGQVKVAFRVGILHNESRPSLFPGLRSSSRKSPVYQNDCAVFFQSSLPFHQFCRQFAASSYNNPDHYHFLLHNCAFAANHALKIAGIDLKIGRMVMTSPIPYMEQYLRIPTPILTPRELFNIAQAYKISEVQNTIRALPLKSLALKGFAEKNQDPQLTGLANDISDQLLNQVQHYPHRAEQYEALLSDCIQTLKTGASKPNTINYRMFQNRREHPTDVFFRKCAISLILTCVVSVLLEYFPEANENDGQTPLRNGSVVLMALSFLLFYGQFYVENERYLNEGKIADSPLSDSLRKFNQLMFKKADEPESASNAPSLSSASS